MGTEQDGGGGDGAGTSVIDSIQSVSDCRAHQKKLRQRVRCVGEPCSMVAGLGFQGKNWVQDFREDKSLHRALYTVMTSESLS